MIGGFFIGYNMKLKGRLKQYTKDIINLYKDGFSLKNIGDKYDASHDSIYKLLKRNYIKVRPRTIYSVNDKFFDNIDTEAKAWTLGWFYTDGTNAKSGHSIILQITDLDVVEKIKTLLEYTGQIRIIQPRGIAKKIQYCLEVSNTKLSSALSGVGCISNKTLVLSYPSTDILLEV